MRPEHHPQGDPCVKCGLAAARHRMRKRSRAGYFRSYKRKEVERQIIGIDGEGFTREDGKHVYSYLAACDESGLVLDLYREEGIKTSEVFAFLLALPADALKVGFSLGYDRAKWIEDLPDSAIYSIEHPEERPGEHGPLPCRVGAFRINLVATRFTVSVWDGEKKKTSTVWDLFRFFQQSFVETLKKWNVGTKDEIQDIADMKAKRGSFRGISKKEQRYCQSECVLLAKLARALITAHEEEGLHLTSYFGPGSTASIILKRCGADKQKSIFPDEMRSAVLSAYFGGRFECSHVGPIKGPLYGYDIASAYPYAQARMGCLAHGSWNFTRKLGAIIGAMVSGAYVLVSYRIHDHKDAPQAWGPLPHRTPNGEILYPVRSAGGWAWSPEVLQAMKLHPGVEIIEAWIWRSDCGCPRPFERDLVDLFNRRLALGKSTRGLTIKLGMNSCYGKSAQSVGGGGAYRCMVRAGWITSCTRAMLLDAVRRAGNPWDILELATDSVLSRTPLALPAPETLGTEGPAESLGKVPLGAWEAKAWPHGAFLIRPGMRFALGEGDGPDHTAARGLGVRVLHRNRACILAAWAELPMGPLSVQQPPLYHGSRSSVYRVGEEYRRSPLYGRWEPPTPRTLSYAPGPKRSGIMPSPTCHPALALVPWLLPMGDEARSTPYAGTPDDEMRIMHEEQPEIGFLDYV